MPIWMRDPPWPRGYDSWLTNVRSQVRVSVAGSRWAGWPGSYIYVCRIVKAIYGASATEIHIETICKERGISSRFRLSISL